MSRIKRAVVALVVAVSSIGFLGGAASPAEAATPCVHKLYRYGSKGDCVRYVQALANYHRYGTPVLVVDGVWGSKTEVAVRRIQETWAILKVDGIVGPKTWGVLCTPAQGSVEAPNRVPGNYPIWAARGAGCPGANNYYY